MARITLFPGTQCAQIDGELAQEVNFSGIDPTIHCVQWYDTIGTLEFVEDPITGEKPQNQTINSISPYLSYVETASEIIYAANNPQVFYSISNSTEWEGVTVPLGNAIYIDTVDGVPPVTSTNEVPPTPSDFQQLWWYAQGSTWIISPFDPTLTLSQAKEQLIGQVETSGAGQADYQARIYSAYQLVSAADAGVLPTADYFGLDLATYQTYIDGQVAIKTSQINGAVATGQLYDFDWRIEGDPNA